MVRPHIIHMGEAARPLRGRRAGPPSQQPQPVRAVGAEDGKDLARLIAEQFGNGPVHEVKTVVYRRPPHDMLGADGYSLVSNYFVRRVLPYCLMHNIISKLQAAVLSNMIGRQKKGKIEATHAEIAEELGVKRTSIGHALGRPVREEPIRDAGVELVGGPLDLADKRVLVSRARRPSRRSPRPGGSATVFAERLGGGRPNPGVEEIGTPAPHLRSGDLPQGDRAERGQDVLDWLTAEEVSERIAEVFAIRLLDALDGNGPHARSHDGKSLIAAR